MTLLKQNRYDPLPLEGLDAKASRPQAGGVGVFAVILSFFTDKTPYLQKLRTCKKQVQVFVSSPSRGAETAMVVQSIWCMG